MMWESRITCLSYYFHIFLWAPRTPGPGLKETAGRARAGPPAAALWPGPWFQATKTENSIDNICKNVQMMWLDSFTLFTFVSYYFEYLFHMLVLKTQIRTPKIISMTYSWSNLFHMIFMFLYMHGLGPCLSCNLRRKWVWHRRCVDCLKTYIDPIVIEDI